MTNVFDQFDPQPQAPATQPDGSNIFDQFDPPSSKPMSAMETAGDVVQGAGAGIERGAAGAIGLPGDTSNMATSLWNRAALGLIHKGFDWTGYGPQAGTPERQEFDKDEIGLAEGNTTLPTSQGVVKGIESAAGPIYQPKSTAGQYAQTVGEFVPGAILGPESVAKKIAYGAVAPGVTSEAAGQATQGTALEPYARAVGAVAGVGGGAAVSEASRLAGKGAAKIGETFRPMTEAGQAQMAADRLGGATLDLDKTKAALADAGNPELVPGSQPTTFQLTGDMGLGAAEKVAETQNPVPFQQRRADQNAARVTAMTSLQPTGGAEDLAAGLRAHLSALDDIEAGKVSSATTTAQDAATGLGGQQSADFYGSQLQRAAQPQIDAAHQGLQSALDRVGGVTTPEASGSAMRGIAQNAQEQARQQRNALYRAIDPDGTLNTVVTGPRERAAELAGQISPMAAQPAGEEAAILGQMQKMPDVVPFRDLQALDTRITAAMSQEARTAGQTPTWGRLSQLKGSVQDAISNGVANQVAYERHGIATGQLPVEQSLEARLAAYLSDQVKGFYANRESGLASGTQGYAAGAGGGSPTSSRVSRAAGPAGRGSRGDESAERIPSEASLAPNFDQAAADRLAAAKQVHAEYARAFKQGPVGNMLKTNGHAGQYHLIDSGVPNQVFQPGPKGGDTLRSYMGAVGNSAEAAGAVQNYAAMSLRRAAQNPDGTINPARYTAWLAKHQDALGALPNGRQTFGAIGPAQAALDRFAPFTEAHAPSAIPEMFFHSGPSGGEGVANLRGIIGDQQATTTLTDYAASKLRSQAMNSDGTLDPRKVASFVKTHQPALDALPGLADRFSSAARATETIAQAAAARKAATDAFQRDAVGKIMGSTEPADISRMVGDIFPKANAVAQMSDLAAKARAAGPDAVQGLRKAVADHIVGRFMANGEAGTSGVSKISANAFQTFVRKNTPALSQVFKPDEVKSLQSIADDITRANRSRDSINIPGQSATSQLQHHVAPAGHEPSSWLQSVFFASHGAKEIGHSLEHVPLVGEALNSLVGHLAVPVAVGRHLINTMRASGLHKVDDLYREALLNPGLAKELLAKVKPSAAAKAPAAGLITQLGRLSPFYGAQQQPDATTARASGGRVEPTDAQKEAGNYRKDHVRFAGMDISIENRKGAQRSGIGKGGHRWSVTMPAHYGYIKGTTGADGDHVDCYIGPDAHAPDAFVVDQVELPSRSFDEHKVMLGFASEREAVATYIKGFSDGKGSQRIGKVTRMPVSQVQTWARSAAARRPMRARGGYVPSFDAEGDISRALDVCYGR